MTKGAQRSRQTPRGGRPSTRRKPSYERQVAVAQITIPTVVALAAIAVPLLYQSGLPLLALIVFDLAGLVTLVVLRALAAPKVLASLLAVLVTLNGTVAVVSPRKASTNPWCRPFGPNSSADIGRLLPNQHGPLRLVDLTISESVAAGRLGCVRFDTRLRNVGPEVVFLKKATLDIRRVRPLNPTCVGGRGGGGVPPSANYNVTIELSRVPYSVDVQGFSQELEPQDVDRFMITARIDDTSAQAPPVAVVEADLRYTYNEDSQVLRSPTLLFLSTPVYQPGEFAPPTTASHRLADDPRVADDALNRRRVMETASLPAVRSPGIQQLSTFMRRPDRAPCLF
jgi:hypothetical protein